MSDYNITDLLSPAFLERMQKMLGDEYEDFIKSYEAPRTYGLRVNTAKISCEEFEKIVPFPVTPIPWIPNGYFYPGDVRPSFCPLYQAGLYYLQEPSAMTPASCLPVTPGENILDLCAAPGGKATALGAMLNGSGLLVANDISSSRTRALLRNIELFGIANAFVTNETPTHLKNRFPEFFHKILLDAPCSGEGMFRKEDALARDWTPEKSDELSVLQKELTRLQNEMYLKRIPVVVALEGWDAAGKGGNIKRITEALDPRGYEVCPIASPEPHEKARHYLWRFWTRLPKDGHIAIFDRTWYGRVMVERLEGFCSENDWKRAYNEMNEFEKELHDWGAVIIKFWVQINKDTQLERFNDRQNTPEKQWKITEEDWRNREKWDQYEVAVNEMIQKTSTTFAPWHVLESVDKKYARIKALRIVVEELERALK